MSFNKKTPRSPLERINQSRVLSAVVYTGIFLLFVIINYLTLWIADDYSYLYRFDNGERIDNLFDIFPSMAAHAKNVNGRLVAHGLVQLMLMLPPWVFDVVNAAIFVLQIYLIGKISTGEKCNNLLLIAIFCAIWIYEPAFGQINLWQDGAGNYLWAIVACLLYIKPFVDVFLNNKPLERTTGKIALMILGVVAGGFSESCSVAVLLIAAALAGYDLLVRKRKPLKYQTASIILGFISYISIYLSPAQWSNKAGGGNITVFLLRLTECVERYTWFGILAGVFVILLAISVSTKVNKERIWLAVFFVFGSLCANFIMVFAAGYPPRATAGAFILLVVADAILLQGVFDIKQYKLMAICCMLLLLLATPYKLLSGCADIYMTYADMSFNIEYIEQCKMNGEQEIALPMVVSKTKYSALDGLQYLDVNTPDAWPNSVIARYYGVDLLICISE